MSNTPEAVRHRHGNGARHTEHWRSRPLHSRKSRAFADSAVALAVTNPSYPNIRNAEERVSAALSGDTVKSVNSGLEHRLDKAKWNFLPDLLRKAEIDAGAWMDGADKGPLTGDEITPSEPLLTIGILNRRLGVYGKQYADGLYDGFLPGITNPIHETMERYVEDLRFGTPGFTAFADGIAEIGAVARNGHSIDKMDREGARGILEHEGENAEDAGDTVIAFSRILKSIQINKDQYPAGAYRSAQADFSYILANLYISEQINLLEQNPGVQIVTHADEETESGEGQTLTLHELQTEALHSAYKKLDVKRKIIIKNSSKSHGKRTSTEPGTIPIESIDTALSKEERALEAYLSGVTNGSAELIAVTDYAHALSAAAAETEFIGELAHAKAEGASEFSIKYAETMLRDAKESYHANKETMRNHENTIPGYFQAQDTLSELLWNYYHAEQQRVFHSGPKITHIAKDNVQPGNALGSSKSQLSGSSMDAQPKPSDQESDSPLTFKAQAQLLHALSYKLQMNQIMVEERINLHE